jgi:NAD(P)-dependent dehydrogenase (short-subunit alcohol dehydrogenase family)
MTPPDSARRDPYDFTGRVALVTGAARGIGATVAGTLADRGAVVALADCLPVQDWDESSRELLADGATAHFVDIRQAASCRSLLDEIASLHGRLDHLVNNAGVVRRGAAVDTTDEDFSEILDVNLVGTFRVTTAAYDLLRRAQGSVVSVGSTNGHIAVPNTIGYCVSKAGVMHMARVLALEWATDGIRVNAVGPTIVPTTMTADVRADEDYMAEKLATIPLGRMATAQDVADTITYLLSPAASMITGQTVFVDGGVTIH